MVKRATYGSVRRLGSRYGRTVRFKLGKIESEQRKKHKCPYCSYVKVRRITAGIWKCGKCGATFTNKAYTIGKLASIKEMIEESQKQEAERKAFEKAAKKQEEAKAKEEAEA
ncbi:MAG TPA: 50S ribosomal protein L37ae [Candidatus Nanoarchaeia archaeon]|nr:50S ribosomal protein L37ae [Candidatus Nanoarchaeia archaeon]